MTNSTLSSIMAEDDKNGRMLAIKLQSKIVDVQGDSFPAVDSRLLLFARPCFSSLLRR